MATRARNTAAPNRAPSNVVRLPTAPKRKVQQNHNRSARAAREALPQFGGERLFPGQRRALRRAERLAKIERTPALMIAMALYRALDAETRQRVMLSLAPAVVDEAGPCRDAVEMLLLATMTFGEQIDLQWANDRLAGVR